MASSGGQGIGSNLGAGVNAGIDGWTQTIANTAARQVNNAIAAARNAAQVRSPSKRTIKLGRQIAQGLQVGVQKGSPGVSKSLEKLTRRIDKYIGKRYKNASQKAQNRYFKRVRKHLKDEYKALRRNGRAQERNNRRLDAARQKLREIRQESRQYGNAIRDTLVQSGDITQLGRLDDGSVSGTRLLDQLRQEAAQAKRFSALIRDLTASGLNDTSLKQMLAAGPEVALATAEAIKAGGQSSIDEINALTKSLTDTGTSLGNSMADEFYGAGIKAAEGLVKGLERRERRLDRTARRLARKLTKAVKKALKIRSPSKVFEGIGQNVTKGLTIGLDDTYVRRAGTATAEALVKGFGAPALDAYASSAGAVQPIAARVQLTAEQVDQLQRGRAIQLDLDAYRRVGGRVTQ